MRNSLHVLTIITAVVVTFLSARAQQPPAAAAPPLTGTPGTESGLATFQTRCSVCHNNPVQGAPTASAIREMTTEKIYDSLVSGSMKMHAEGLSNIQKQRVAEFMSGRPLGSAKVGDAKNMPNQCRNNPTLVDPAGGPGWNGWGADSANTRFQPADQANLPAADVPRLTLKWASAFPTRPSPGHNRRSREDGCSSAARTARSTPSTRRPDASDGRLPPPAEFARR